MAQRYDIVRIDFQANARGANAAIESLRVKAEDCNEKVSQLKKQLKDGIKMGKPTDELEKIRTDLRSAEKEARQFKKGYDELAKGMRTLDTAIKAFNDGSLAQMSQAFQKAANNAAKLTRTKLDPMSDSYKEDYRQLTALMDATQQNYARMQGDAQQMIKTLKEGGKVAVAALQEELAAQRELKSVLAETDTGYQRTVKNIAVLEQYLRAMGGDYEFVRQNITDTKKVSDDMLRNMYAELQRTNQEGKVTKDIMRENATAMKEIRAEQARRVENVLGGNLGRQSEQSIRAAIANAKELLVTYKSNSKEAQALSAQIVNAEEHLKAHGIEAARAAQREAAAIKTQEDAEKQLQATMNKRMTTLKTLSADALAETRKYWEAQRNGAEQGTAAYKKAESALKSIDNLQRNRRVEQLDNILGNPSKHGIAEVRDALREMEKLRDSVQKQTPAWNHYNKMVNDAKTYLDNLAKSEAAERINQQMQQLTRLSAKGLADVKAYWQAQMDGAARGSQAFNEAEAALKRINTLETNRKSANSFRVLNNMGLYGDEEIRRAIQAVEQLRDAQAHGSPQWELYNKRVQEGKAYLDEWSKTDSIIKMEERMNRLPQLSDAAMNETKKFWETMVAGADKGSRELAEYEAHLQKVMQEERERRQIANEIAVQRLDNNLDAQSEQEIREAIEAGKQLIQTYQTASPEADALAKKIVAAEEHLKQYGIEAERAAKKEAQAIAEAARKRQEADNLMKQQLQQGSQLSQSALRAQEQYWQRLIDDPKTAAASLQEYQQNLDKVRLLQQMMMEQQGSDALDFFRDKNRVENASADHIKQQAEALKKFRDSMPQKANADIIAEIDGYLQKVSATTQKATEQTMTWKQAMQVSAQAGTGSFKGTTEQLNLAKKTLEDMSAKAVKGGLAWRRMQEALQRIEVELKNVGHLSQEVQGVLDSPKGKSFNALKQAVEQGRLALNAMDRTTKEGQKAFDDLAKKVKAADIEMKQLAGTSKGTASAFDKAWSRLKTYVGLYVGAAVAMQKLTAAMGDLLELSDRMGEVRKTTGFTADEVGRLSNNLAKLDTRTTLTQLMELSSLAGSVGLKTQEQVQGFTEAADQLIVALPELGNESARTIIKIANATGDLEKNGGNVRETLEKVGSTIIALRANSASAAPQITDFVSRVGAVGAQAGISIDQIAALGSTIDALGGRVEMSATALSRMIPAIKNNSFAIANSIGVTEKYLKSLAPMEQMVLIFKKMRDNIAGIDTTTEEGMNAMADNVEAFLGKNATMREVMKDLEQQGARAGIVFGLLSQNVDELQKQLGIASEAYRENTALANEFANMNETTAAKWERLKNKVEEFFVGDQAQRFLGDIIDGLRKIVDLLTGPLKTAVFNLGIVFATFKLGVGEAVVAMLGWLTNVGRIVVQSARAVTSMQALSASTRLARMEWKKMEAATKTNIWGAVVAAIGLVVYNIYEHIKAVKEAAAEIGRFNQKVADEKKALDDLFTPLQKSNIAQDERSKLISEINSKYSRYLGFMLSETNSAIQLADAHALIAKRIREEAYEKRIMDQEDKVRQRHAEDINTAYGGIENAVRDAIRGDTNVQDVTDSLKRFVDSSMPRILQTSAVQAFSGTSVGKELEQRIERMVVDGKLSRDAARDVYRAVTSYAKEARSQAEEMQRATANSRADLRNTQREIAGDINANLNDLVKNIKDFGKPTPAVTAKPTQQQNPLQPQWGQQPIDWRGNSQVQANVQVPLPSDRPQIDKKNIEQVKQYVEYQDQLRGYLQANAGQIDEQTRKTAEMYLESEEEMKKLRALLPKDAGSGNGGGGGAGTSPYGSYNRVTSPYQDWDADALVSRRKEMLERVRALANGADVQAVLSEDAKFISEATRKNIKDTKQAIEWYNTERLKIQDALHERYLTNTGDWRDDTEGGRKRKPQFYESDYALAELDRYYSRRKEALEKAREEENMTEELYNREVELLEQEHLAKRSKLRETFTSEDKQMIEQFRAWWAKLAETGDLAEVPWATVESEWSKATDAQWGANNRKAQEDLTKLQGITVKHLNAIAKIIDKERPYDGITANLRDNLLKMDILLADYQKNGPTEDTAALVRAQTERLKFLLGEAEHAYTSTIEDVLRRMGEAGMTAWAEEIRRSPAMQNALMAQLQTAYDEIQNAIKKEASLIKKQTDIWWNDIAQGQTQSRKGGFEKMLSDLALSEDRVKRANQLIGAGQASERVADKLAIAQMKVRLQMQETYYNRMRQMWADRIASLRARGKEIDAQHAEMSRNLSLAEEQKKLDEQRVAIANQLEESNNRLYTELKSYADLLTSSLQSVFEASHAGDAEYYNELAKLNLTGNGGPGAGTYIVIDNEGTSDATAHYEYLDEREALERQHEIERENAQFEAWKKVMDDINMKMSETITDQLNAMLQNASVDANTDALGANTQAVLGLTGAITGESGKVLGTGDMGVDENGVPNALKAPEAEGYNFGSMWNTEGDGSGWDPETNSWVVQAEASTVAKETILKNQQDIAQGQVQTDTKMQKSAQSAFAKMTAAANLYGVAYQVMSNDNMSASQKFGMIAVQAAGNAAITALTTNLSQTTGQVAAETPSVLSKLWSLLGWGAIPVFAIFTGLLGGLMGLAASKIAKSKSEIAQATGVSASAGKLATGMLTYAEGNVNEFTDPASLTPGKQYNVDAADGRTYRARYMGRNPKTHLTNGPEFHLSGERGREMIIDAGTTRQITMNEAEIWHAIQTLSGGGRISAMRRRGRGVAAFADGNVEDFVDVGGDTIAAQRSGAGFDPAAMQASLDRNSAVQEALLERLSQPIETFVSPYGPRGIVAGYDRYKAQAQRYGQKY